MGLNNEKEIYNKWDDDIESSGQYTSPKCSTSPSYAVNHGSTQSNQTNGDSKCDSKLYHSFDQGNVDIQISHGRWFCRSSNVKKNSIKEERFALSILPLDVKF
mmetsp:Transcript_2617/g.3751  ORF Transcript_2617/g.3751 Transcript_2617/m.3751 type:complete len:103 (-) Transcript_2617:218-526(-)